MAPLEIELTSAPHLPPHAPGPALFTHGDLAVRRDGGACLVESPAASLRVRADGSRIEGVVRTGADPGVLAGTDLLVAFALALQPRGLHHLHAAATIAPSGDVVLIAGTGGAGKSTLALALVAAGHAYLGDDVVFIQAGGESPSAAPLTPALSPRGAGGEGGPLHPPSPSSHAARRKGGPLHSPSPSSHAARREGGPLHPPSPSSHAARREGEPASPSPPAERGERAGVRGAEITSIPHLLALPRPFHLSLASASAHPPALAHLDAVRRTSAGKHLLDPRAAFPGAARAEAPAPAVLLLPEIAPRPSTALEPVPPAEALGALLASALFAFTPLGTPAQRDALAAVAGAARAFRVLLGRDLLDDAVATAHRIAREAGLEPRG